MLKSFDLLKYLIEPVVYALEVGPRRPCKAPQEKCEADCESDVLRRSSCPLEESCFNASGQWVLVNDACREGVQLAYIATRIGAS